MSPRPLLLVLLLALPSVAPVAASDPPLTDEDRVERALAWLAAQQMEDGGWNTPSEGYAVEAAASAGHDPKTWPSGERSAFAALVPLAPSGDSVPNPDEQDRVYKSILRIAHAAGISGYDPHDVNGRDLVALLREGFTAGQFGDARYINDDVWAILALRAAGVPKEDAQIQAAVGNILRGRLPDGGWAHVTFATASSTDITGMALAALAAAGEDVSKDERARALILSRQQKEGVDQGGFRDIQDNPTVQSTVWGIHALHLLGEPEGAALRYLRDKQDEATGAYFDVFSTTEAVVVLAGARYPLPSYTPATPEEPHALLPDPLDLGALFGSVAWTFPSEVAAEPEGFVFPHAGDYPYEVYADGPQARYRGTGTLHVLSALPVAAFTPSADSLFRGAPLRLELARSRDPDGALGAWRVDWGDGTREEGAWTSVPSHAYAVPGTFSVRVEVQDDAGAWSAPAEANVLVLNRAPVLAGLPSEVVANRTAPVRLAPQASDADGDEVHVRWRAGAQEGEGPLDLRFDALGVHEVTFEATDAFDALAVARVVVRVLNLPPVLGAPKLPAAVVANEMFAFNVSAEDPDGPAPQVAWRIGNLTWEGAEGSASLPAGVHAVEVIARDADGETRNVTSTLVVAALDAPPTPRPPRLENLSATLEAGMLSVRFDTDGAVTGTLAWWSDDARGEVSLEASEAEVPVGAAREVRVRVRLAHGNLTASAEIGPIRAPAQPALATPAVLLAGVPEAGVPFEVRVSAPPEATGFRFAWGDGTMTEWLDAPAAVHAWPAAGAYRLAVEAQAPDGRTSRAEAAVEVAQPTRQESKSGTGGEDAATAEGSLDEASVAEVSTQEEPLSEDAPEAVQPADSAPARHEVPGAPLAVLAALFVAARARGARR